MPAAREFVLFKRRRVPPVQGVEGGPAAETRSTTLHWVALGAALCAALPAPASSAAPLRDAQGLAVSCRLSGMPAGEAAAAEARLCTQVIAMAQRGSPYAVGGALPPDVVAPRLAIEGRVTGAGAARRLAVTAKLSRPGQANAPRLSATPPAVAFDDAVAVAAAIESALSAVLPWRATGERRVPTPPRAY